MNVATVFLTYRQSNSKNPKHKDAVRSLGLRLRAVGVTVILDQFANEEEFDFGGPPDANGWAGWSYAQVEEADKVLIVGSIDYYRTYESKEPVGVGLGAAVEAQRIFAQLSQQNGQNERFRVVILNSGDEEEIPDHLVNYHRFYPNGESSGFDDLARWVNASTAISKTEQLLRRTIVWPSMVEDYRADLANRGSEFAFLKEMVSGKTAERAMFLKAPPEHGKTRLVSECMKYALQVLGAGSCTVVDFKVNPTREAALDTLALDLPALLPTFTKSGNQLRELRADLRVLTKPILLLFDTYENASEDARSVLHLVLADLEATKAVCVIVAGQNVPEHTTTVWAKSVQRFLLGKIFDSAHWVEYAQRHHPSLPPEDVKVLTDAATGTPGLVSTLLMSLAASRAV